MFNKIKMFNIQHRVSFLLIRPTDVWFSILDKPKWKINKEGGSLLPLLVTIGCKI